MMRQPDISRGQEMGVWQGWGLGREWGRQDEELATNDAQASESSGSEYETLHSKNLVCVLSYACMCEVFVRGASGTKYSDRRLLL